ncbi:viral tegument-like protein [Salmonella phage allotria]|uniref:Viral tegument-like protein n=1 Tax=Salmonella phage allotria TaxID=2713274 RepID=A0A6G8RM93_9CAUD|nr:MazG-like pyrophosphatase [Salmonella phage allotria]QIO02492.1 viral tegument-like protein [Salmonella phage allotria]
MKFIHTIIDTSYDCTAREPNRSPVFVLNKLGEEICELSDVFHGIGMPSEPLNGEVADVFISAIDLLYIMDFNDQQLHGCMTKEELADSVQTCLALCSDCSPEYLEEDWFRLIDRDPQNHLNLIHHYHGRIIRLCNQPYRSQDVLVRLVANLITHVARMACGEGAIRGCSLMATRIKVDHTFNHKIEKWRTKFGL